MSTSAAAANTTMASASTSVNVNANTVNANANANVNGLAPHGFVLPGLGQLNAITSLDRSFDQPARLVPSNSLLTPIAPQQPQQQQQQQQPHQLKRRRPPHEASHMEMAISLTDNAPDDIVPLDRSCVRAPHVPTFSNRTRNGSSSIVATTPATTVKAMATPAATLTTVKNDGNGIQLVNHKSIATEKLDSPRRPVPPKRLKVPQSNSTVVLHHQHKVLRSSTNSSVAPTVLGNGIHTSMIAQAGGVTTTAASIDTASLVASAKEDAMRIATTTTGKAIAPGTDRTAEIASSQSSKIMANSMGSSEPEPMDLEADGSRSTSTKMTIEALRIRFQHLLSSWELNEMEQFGAADVCFVGTAAAKRQRLEKAKSQIRMQQQQQRKVDETKPATTTASIATKDNPSPAQQQQQQQQQQPPQQQQSEESKATPQQQPPPQQQAPEDPTFDDEKGDYVVIPHDHLAFRYEVLEVLGSGSFGQVVKCLDHLSQQQVAIKITRNRKRFKELSLQEVDMLVLLGGKNASSPPASRKTSKNSTTTTSSTAKTKASTSNPTSVQATEAASTMNATITVHQAVPHIVQMYHSFHFRNHLCIVFECLGLNLYEYLKLHHFQGLQLPIVRRVASQMLQSLRGIHALNVVHCDLKPENILIRKMDVQNEIASIAMIDFGSSCFANATMFSYIQSRFYRSPEVILGFGYGCAIDVWSVGCILAELFTGIPLFAGENEKEQLACIMEILNMPPRGFLSHCKRKHVFFMEKPMESTDSASASTTASALAPEAPGTGGSQVLAPTTAQSSQQVSVPANSNSPTTMLVPLHLINTRGRTRTPGTKTLESAVKTHDPMFVRFLRRCLEWDPTQRWTCAEALEDPWLSIPAEPTLRSTGTKKTLPPI